MHFEPRLSEYGLERKVEMNKKAKYALAAFFACALLSCGVRAKEESSPIIIHERFTSDADGFFIEDNTAFMPVRSLAALCAEDAYIAWDEKNRTVYLSTESADFAMSDRDKTVQSRAKVMSLSAEPKVQNGRMCVPVRETASLLGFDVTWDSDDRSIALEKRDGEGDIDDTLLWLSRIIFAEARGEPFEGKIAVGNVVLERMKSDEFPNSVYDVIFDRNPVVQFTPLANFTLFNIPDESCIDAARRVLDGEKAVEGCLYFVNPVKTTSDWVMKNREFAAMIGNHAFYK